MKYFEITVLPLWKMYSIIMSHVNLSGLVNDSITIYVYSNGNKGVVSNILLPILAPVAFPSSAIP